MSHNPSRVPASNVGVILAQQMKPRFLRLADATTYSGLSRSELYRLAGAGKIDFVKSGASTLAVTESLDAHLDSLPKAKISAAA